METTFSSSFQYAWYVWGMQLDYTNNTTPVQVHLF